MRKKYKPKPVNPDNMSWVLSGFKKVGSLPVAGVKLLTTNRAALDEVMFGRGTFEHVDILIEAMNIAEALAINRLGHDWLPEILDAQEALRNLGQRGVSGSRFVFKGEEMQSVKLAMDVHDEQLAHCSVKQLEIAMDYVQRVKRAGKAQKITVVVDK
jgi:hypothetical protein